jgi:hypothetical protein
MDLLLRHYVAQNNCENWKWPDAFYYRSIYFKICMFILPLILKTQYIN